MYYVLLFRGQIYSKTTKRGWFILVQSQVCVKEMEKVWVLFGNFLLSLQRLFDE